MAADAAPIWWIEVIKISPGLISAGLAVALVAFYHKEVRALLTRMTKFKALGVEAEFSAKAMDGAIIAQGVQVSDGDRKGALKRLAFIAPLLRDARMLWVDDNPASTRNERAVLEGFGARVDTVTSSAEAERAVRDNIYTLVITDLKREGRDDEGLQFVSRLVASRTYVWTIAYTGSDQTGKARPANLFGITNRPDHLMHLVCDIVEREKL
jgi:CheY-like chemotaxis protein